MQETDVQVCVHNLPFIILQAKLVLLLIIMSTLLTSDSFACI